MRSRNLTGQRFGKLLVVGDSGQRKDRSILWRCRCDCGRETLVVTHALTSGVTASCGCDLEPRTSRREAENLAGQRFGMLTVLRRVENRAGRTQWLCQCDCGKLHTATAFALKQGKVKSCGCAKYGFFGGIDLTGRRFGRLVALYPRQGCRKRTSAVWHCRCDCGNEIDTTAECLASGCTCSCGCLTRELGERLHTYLHLTQDTCLERLISNQKTHKNNAAGFRGLSRTKSGAFRVMITFQKKTYQLGTFRSFDAAVNARLDAEAVLHKGFIGAYERYERRAANEPQWAEENPFYYRVERSDGRFQVETNA